MSVEAISWALNRAPVPADRGGQPSSACKFVLVGLANHAGPDGTGAFPSVATLVRYTGLSERTVRTCLDRLEADGIISPCDPDLIAARIKRADRRPQGWDLNLALVRDDLAEAAGTGAMDCMVPVVSLVGATGPSRWVGKSNGVKSLHPETGTVDNLPGEMQPLHPAPRTGCNQRANGVQPVQPRGAVGAPEPSREPSLKPSAARTDAREPALADGRTGGGGPVGEFFAALGGGWRLTLSQRARLSPVLQTALSTGWTPAALAAFTGANTDGVRSPSAVLAARLSMAELPDPPSRSAPPPWCGQCDERTRLLGFDGDAPAPCQRCKPNRNGGPGNSSPAVAR